MHDIKDSAKNFAFGEVSVFYRPKDGGVSTLAASKKNLITYGGADIMARLLSGDVRYSISHMYFMYKNGINLVAPSISRENTVDEFLSIDGLSEIDWLRVPIITSAKIDKSSPTETPEIYSGNRCTFVATTASVKQFGESLQSLPFSNTEGSKVFSVALVASPEKNDKTKDVLFARTNITQIAVIENSYIDVFWSVTFA